MKGAYTHNIPRLMDSRKQLRNNATREEKLLWEHLKGSKAGYKFRRQHSIDNFIVDFYCAEKKAAIELDGAHHFTEEGKIYDIERTQHLKMHGVKMIRFANSEVTNDVGKVVYQIISFINSA